MTPAVRIMIYMLRGYGQMFLCGSATAGAIFLLALGVISPPLALWSLVGCFTVTVLGLRLTRMPWLLSSGLFGVNGVLLGAVWAYWPELGEWSRGAATLAGSACIALVLAPVVSWMHRRKSPYLVFSMPHVLAGWCVLGVFAGFGATDARLHAGWRALRDGRFEVARGWFQSADVRTSKAQAVRLDGLGWASFKQADYVSAREFFRQALAADSSLADAQDGVGWSALRLGDDSAARAAFESALREAPGMADSWDGLGWLALRTGDTAEARRCFGAAVWCAPLFADGWLGLAQCHPAAPDAARYRMIGEGMKRHVLPTFHFLPARELVAWLLFALGVLVHSRVSFGYAMAALAACACGVHWLPALAATFADVPFVFNLLVTFIAFGGLYLRLRGWGVVVLPAVAVAMAWGWQCLAPVLDLAGLPMLSLPFNVVLLGALLVVRQLLPSAMGQRLAVPLDVAATSPEKVRLWGQKAEIASECWERLEPRT